MEKLVVDKMLWKVVRIPKKILLYSSSYRYALNTEDFSKPISVLNNFFFFLNFLVSTICKM